MANESTCPTCRIVQTVCWGPFRVAPWKRPALLLMSILVIGGALAFGIFTITRTNTTWQWAVLVPVLGLGILGMVTAVRGCLNCVSRIFGGI